MTRYFILIFLWLISNCVFSQIKLNIAWDRSERLFYETPDLKKLPVTFENMNDEFKTIIKKSLKSGTLLKKVIFDNDDGCHTYATFIFKKSPSINDVKVILESLNIKEFYVNNNRVLTRTLISTEEAKDNAMQFKFKDMPFNSTFNDSTRIEYYDFQVYYAGTKLQYMQGKDYPKYLYEGYIAKFTEQLEHYTQAREAFIKRNQKK